MVSTIGPYLIALVSVFCVFILRWLADPFLGHYYPFQFFFISVIVTVRFTRLAPSLLALFLGGVLGTFFFVEPRHSLIFVQPNFAVGCVIYYFVSSIIIYYVIQTKQQKKQLQEKSVWLQRLINTSPDILFVLDVREMKNTFISKEIHTYLGYQPEQILALGNQVLDKVIHPDDLPNLLQIYQRMDSLPDNTVSESLVRLRHADGTYRTFHTRRAVFSRGEDGRVKEITGTMRDITMLQEAEESLRKSEERYRLINRATHDIVWDWDLTTNHLEWNEAVETAFGYRQQEIGSSIHELYNLIHPEDRERVIRGIHTAIDKNDESWSDEYRFRRKDGVYVVVLDRGYIARDAEGKAYRMIGSMLDLTQRIQAEEALQVSESRYRELIQNANSAIIRWRKDGTITFFNEFAQSFFGYSAEEIIGQNVIILVPPQDSEGTDLTGLLQAIVNQPEHFINHINENICRDGRRVWMTWTNKPIFDENGQLVEILAIGSDITDRKKMEEALRLSESFYRQTLESIPGMVFTTRPDGYCDYQSQQWVEYTGVPLSEHLGDGWNRLLHPDDRARSYDAWQAAVEGRAPYDLEYRVRRHDGEYEWFKVIGQPIRNEADEIVRWFGVALNVEQLKQTEETLREADRRKDEFLAILGHELRNPLAAITTAIKLMNRPNQDAQKELRFKGIIEEQSQQLNRILSDLLDISRIARGKIKVEMQEVRVAEVVEKSLESIHKSCMDLGHQLSVECPVDHLYVNGDPARLQQILVNLLNNACKYTPEGGQIHLVVEEEDESVILRVIDNGIGIPLEAQPHIFDMFTQVESSKQKSQGGLGIGLSLAKMLVEMHGGTLAVNSEGEGKGSEFIVRLPKKYPALSPPKTPEPSHYENVKGLQVLVVEDNLALGHMLADTVKEHGHNVQYARDGMEAVFLARELRPEVVLLDIGLPKLDGYEVARRLRSELDLKETLIVATTAWGQDRDRQRSAEAGIDYHLVKPVDYSQIAPLISQWHTERSKYVEMDN